MRSKFVCFQILLLFVLAYGGSATADVAQKPADFTQAVIMKALGFMPDDLQPHLSASKKGILAAARAEPGKTSIDLCYFVSKEEGTGLVVFAERFRQARKAVDKAKTISALASHLGHLARSVIALSQPYRSEEAAFKSPERAAFEQELNSQSLLLKADFDGYRRVDNPSKFALAIAKKANAELGKLAAQRDGQKVAEVRSAVFALASNSLADVWWSLLTEPGEASKDSAPGTGTAADYIGNKQSLKFHLAACRHLPAEKNRVYFTTRAQAVAEGFVPCKVCKP